MQSFAAVYPARALTQHLHLPATLALARYRQDHGRYPATLAELIPPCLPALPEAKHDFGTVFYRTAGDGKAFALGWVTPDRLSKYEKTGAGFAEFFSSPGYAVLQETDEKAAQGE